MSKHRDKCPIPLLMRNVILVMVLLKRWFFPSRTRLHEVLTCPSVVLPLICEGVCKCSVFPGVLASLSPLEYHGLTFCLHQTAPGLMDAFKALASPRYLSYNLGPPPSLHPISLTMYLSIPHTSLFCLVEVLAIEHPSSYGHIGLSMSTLCMASRIIFAELTADYLTDLLKNLAGIEGSAPKFLVWRTSPLSYTLASSSVL